MAKRPGRRGRGRPAPRAIRIVPCPRRRQGPSLPCRPDPRWRSGRRSVLRRGEVVMRFSLLALLIGAFLAAGAAAQDESETYRAITAEDPTITVAELNLRLTPLKKAELEAEVSAWIDLLQQKVQAITDTDIAQTRLKTELGEAVAGEGEDPQDFEARKKRLGEERDGLLEALGKLREERTALIDRVNAVLKAFKDKGGDIEEFQKYVAAVSGRMPEIDVTDTGATWAAVTGWLQSKEGGLRWAKNIGFFILTLIVFILLGRILGGIVSRAMRGFRRTSDLLREFFVNSVRKLTIFIGVVVALSYLEVEIGPFLAAIGAAGFVVGFALQGTLSNFASGVMILLYRPYDIGDAVSVAGVSGSVDAMTLVSTTVRSWDNQRIVIPNNKIWGDVITNITGNTTRRVDMVFGVSYGDDIDQAQAILEDIVSRTEGVLKDPAPTIKMHELADSSVNFVVRPWTKTSDYWDVYWAVTREVKKRFDAEGISIPFPQQDVHLHEVKPKPAG
ncbi:MAG: mechanosensitive ion channel [Planctomycetes bacterium]|nr:mechanosensitive ion channel [Planctomycetota bacterium]